MKKYLLLSLIFSFLFFSYTVEAAEMGTSFPTNSQYVPGRNYGFQINCNDIPSISSVTFEWNENNYTQYTSPSVQNSGNIYWINLSDLTVGSYSYRWIVENTSDTLTFSNRYDILKNSSVPIVLTLNGTTGNRSYRLYNIAGFAVTLNIPNKIVKLESTYPDWITQTNTSIIYSSINLTSIGLFTLTASWDGDQNYTPSSKTYYFDSGPPQISGVTTIPNSPTGYIPGIEYKFQVNVNDATLTDVWFESNYAGTMNTYNSNSDPPVQNSSGIFWIFLENLDVRNFSYKWHAKDNLNDESSTDFIDYEILKMSPLVLDVLPSVNIREGTQVTATCYSINPEEINVSKFSFYKNSDLIDNITSSTRMGVFLLSVGTYNFTCNTSGTGNYTNQSITKTITVLAATQQGETENRTEELQITNTNFPSIEIGKNKVASFVLVNDMLKNIFNITVDLIGVPSNWYTIEKPSYMYSGETEDVKINFSIPYDAEEKTYDIKINVKGNTSDRKTIEVNKNVSMQITSPIQNRPPSFFMGYNNVTVTGAESAFLLEWSDDSGLSGYIFSSNISGVWENDSWVSLTGKSGTIDVIKDLNSSAGSVAWKIYANDTNNEWSISDEYIVTPTSIGSDILFTLIVPIALIILIIVVIIIFIRKRGKKGKKEDIEYVYSKEEIENER